MGRKISDPGRRASVIVFGLILCLCPLTGCGGLEAQRDEAMPVLAQPEELYQGQDAEAAPEEGKTGDDGYPALPAGQPEEGDPAGGEEEGSDATEETSGLVTITISAAGDCSLGNYQEQDYSWSFRETYDQQQNESYFLENVYDIFSQDDMTIVNLEGVLTRSEQINEGRTYNIKGDPSYTGILTAGSVEAVSLANNHRLDYGEAGTADTVAALQQAGIAYAYDGIVDCYEVKGVRIGIVSGNESSQGVYVETFLQKGIAKLKEDGADLILACCHWGIEKETYPEDYQRQLGKKCIDWGADLVIGHHPHVLQGIEEYQGKYIIYSLANFCFGANRNPSDKDTMIFQQTFRFLEGERQEETQARIIPCSVSSLRERNDYKPTPATGEEADRIIGRLNELNRDLNVQVAADGSLCAKQ